MVFFASRLKHFWYALVTRVVDQQVETPVPRLSEHFEQFGGLPVMALFDFLRADEIEHFSVRRPA